MKLYEPPIFPEWTGHVSPLIDARRRDIEIARKRGGWLIASLLGAMMWMVVIVIAIALIKS